MKTKLLKNRQGFTIIEVMIVLAIAAIIMVIVFLAVPNLQRNSRNTQRRTDANNVLSLISEFKGNNNGSLPAHVCLSGTTAQVGNGANCATLTAGTVVSGAVSTQTGVITDITATLPAAGSHATVGTLAVFSSATCNASNFPVAGTGTQVAIFYGIEPATVDQCKGG